MTSKQQTSGINNYTKETPLLDYSNGAIQALIKSRNWRHLAPIEQIKCIYNFVRDEIRFGYNSADDLPASQILSDGYGQCNTKATLLMALLRAVGIPNRLHGFTIDKALQKGAIRGIWYFLSPKTIVHSWVEVYIQEQWYFLEGVILDKVYLEKLQSKHETCKTTFCGYGAYTDDFANPPIDWNLNNTFIQHKGINQDFGLFYSPDEFYAKHRQKLNLLKRFMYKKYVRHQMNKNVMRIRNSQ